MSAIDPWDRLSHSFNTHKDVGDVSPCAADNILIAWPALLQGIKKVQDSGKGLAAFDFGCGAGSFAELLCHHGYHVAASDTSQTMIEMAKDNVQNVEFYHGGSEIAANIKQAPFALITSVMVLPFVAVIEQTLDDLDKALEPQGIIAFAVFNPDFIQANMGDDCLFQQNEEGVYLCMKGEKIPVYPSDKSVYDALLKKRGYRRILCKKPKFTREFLKAYPQTMDTLFAEYLVMVYQKSA